MSGRWGGPEATSIRRRERIANLCDLVAEGVSIAEAAKVLCISQSSATDMMAQVRRELGWQAT